MLSSNESPVKTYGVVVDVSALVKIMSVSGVVIPNEKLPTVTADPPVFVSSTSKKFPVEPAAAVIPGSRLKMKSA